MKDGAGLLKFIEDDDPGQLRFGVELFRGRTRSNHVCFTFNCGLDHYKVLRVGDEGNNEIMGCHLRIQVFGYRDVKGNRRGLGKL